VAGRVDARRFGEIDQYLEIQHYEARWWRDACLQYFRTFAGLEVPSGYASPAHALSFYQGLTCPSDVTRLAATRVHGEPLPGDPPVRRRAVGRGARAVYVPCQFTVAQPRAGC
jgi:alpha-glucuronidase